MKTTAKNNIQKASFEVVKGVTSNGKTCLVLVTDKRLSIESFKSLMHDITVAGGYGFTKYFREGDLEATNKTGRFISAINLSEKLFVDLANQYEWEAKQPKAKKAPKATKGANKAAAKQAAIDNPAIAQLLANPDLLKAIQILAGQQS